MTSVAFNFS